MSHVYNFNIDSEKVRWLTKVYPPHANAMLDRWQEKDRLQIGMAAAKEKRQLLISQARALASNSSDEV